MNRWLSYKEEKILYDAKNKYRVKCKCGHTNIILNPKGYKLCSWCKNYVFINPKVEFDYRMKEKLLKERRNNK